MMKVTYILIVAAVLAASATASTDPFVGKWVLNTQRSRYPAGSCPKRMVIEMEAAGEGVRYRSQTTYANGVIARSEYTADYNGKQVLVRGTRGMLLPVFLKRINSRTVVASYTKDLRVVATSRRTVSLDGRTMTITTTSKDRTGRNVTTVGIYQRQQDALIRIDTSKRLPSGR